MLYERLTCDQHFELFARRGDLLRFWDTTAKRRAAGQTLLIISHFIADEQRFDSIVALAVWAGINDAPEPSVRPSCSRSSDLPSPRPPEWFGLRSGRKNRQSSVRYGITAPAGAASARSSRDFLRASIQSVKAAPAAVAAMV